MRKPGRMEFFGRDWCKKRAGEADPLHLRAPWCSSVAGDFALTLRKRLSVSNARGWFALILGGWPISSLSSAAAVCGHQLTCFRLELLLSGSPPDPGPAPPHRHPDCGDLEWCPPVVSGRCRSSHLGDLSVLLQLRLRWGWGFPRAGPSFHVFNRSLGQRRPSHTQPHCIFLVSRLSWKKNRRTPTIAS